MRAITMTVYMLIDDEENPYKWNVAEWLDDPGVVGWNVEEGHEECAACEEGIHE